VTATILTLFPEQLDVNGDSQNARVLATRASWAGVPTEVVGVPLGAGVPATAPAAIVIGSSVDAEIAVVAAALRPLADRLRGWVADGIPLLAVGTGYELLTAGVRLPTGDEVDGLGIFPGRAEPLASRATDDLVVDTVYGRLIGYENHARGISGAFESPLGRVVHGTGNGAGVEGALVGTAIGTHLHGPILAKNPAVADSLLALALGERYSADDARIRQVDDMARAAREVIRARLGVGRGD